MSPKTRSYEPQVAWSEKRRAFIVHYFVDGFRHDKWVPVGIAWEESHRHQALIWFNDWRQVKEQTGVIPSNASVPAPIRSFRNLIDQWFDWRKEQPNTDIKELSKNRAAIVNYVLTHRLGDFDLERPKGLSTLAVDWIEWLQRQKGKHTKRPLAPFTIRNIVQIVRTMLSDFRGKGWCDITDNPFNDPFVKRKTAGAHTVAGADTIIHLSPPQAAQFIQCGDERITPYRRANNVLGLTSGLRTEEIQGLSWFHLHLDEKVPYVDVQRQLKTPGEKPTFKAPKKKSYRQVPLHPVAVQVLKWWRKQWVVWTTREPLDTDPVFPSSDGQYIHHHSASTFRRDLEVAGVPSKFEGHNQTIHSLRRTFLTLLNLAGVTDNLQGRLAGHAKKTVTARHYVARDMPLLYEAVLKLPLPKEVEWAK